MVSIIITDEEHEQRLGGEWFNTPTELAASQLIVEKVLENVGLAPIIEEAAQPKKRAKK